MSSAKPGVANRKLVVQGFVSMDGVMQAPGGPEEDKEGGFAHGGWSMTYWDEKMGQIMGKQQSEPRDLLLGRRTYDIFASYWPNHRNEPGAAELNRATKHVASRTLKELQWENSHLLEGEVSAAVEALKRLSGPPIYVLGSSNLIQTLLEHDLVDEIDLWLFPVVIGSGKRLFGDGAIPKAWKVTNTQTSTTGVIIMHFERGGPIKYGSPS